MNFAENEPAVCRPEEALACFLRTKMDGLVLGDWFIERAALEFGDSSALSFAQASTFNPQLP